MPDCRKLRLLLKGAKRQLAIKTGVLKRCVTVALGISPLPAGQANRAPPVLLDCLQRSSRTSRRPTSSGRLLSVSPGRRAPTSGTSRMPFVDVDSIVSNCGPQADL